MGMSEISRWIILILFVAVSAAFMPAVQAGNSKYPFWKRYLFIGVPSNAALVIIYLVFRGYIDLAMDKINHVAESYSGRGAIALGVICAGIAAHIFKKRSQLRYGQVEVIVGALSAANIAESMSPGEALFSRWVALVGCAYVVARGLNNWSDALAQHEQHTSILAHVTSWFVVKNEQANAKENASQT